VYKKIFKTKLGERFEKWLYKKYGITYRGNNFFKKLENVNNEDIDYYLVKFLEKEHIFIDTYYEYNDNEDLEEFGYKITTSHTYNDSSNYGLMYQRRDIALNKAIRSLFFDKEIHTLDCLDVRSKRKNEDI